MGLLSERSRVILALTLPIVGGMATQEVLDLVDTARVGAPGAAPPAAVCTGGERRRSHAQESASTLTALATTCFMCAITS